MFSYHILCANNGSLFQKLDDELGHLKTIHLHDKEIDWRKLLDNEALCAKMAGAYLH